MVYGTLIDPIVRLASGDYRRWAHDRGGEVFLQAIADLEAGPRSRKLLQPSELFLSTNVLSPSSTRGTR